MSEATIVGYCRACGKALDETSANTAHGTIYCAEHVPLEPIVMPPPLPHDSSAYDFRPQPRIATAQTSSQPSPPLAFLLGCIPGVGAVYNGQYAKGLVHVLILGSIISILANGAARGFEPIFGILIPCFWFYMAFEAYHTAKKRVDGQPVDEFSSLLPLHADSLQAESSHGHAGSSNPKKFRGARFPMVAVLLILFGVVFLLSNLNILDLRSIFRYWPVVLIVLGIFMLYERVTQMRRNDNDRS